MPPTKTTALVSHILRRDRRPTPGAPCCCTDALPRCARLGTDHPTTAQSPKCTTAVIARPIGQGAKHSARHNRFHKLVTVLWHWVAWSAFHEPWYCVLGLVGSWSAVEVPPPMNPRIKLRCTLIEAFDQCCRKQDKGTPAPSVTLHCTQAPPRCRVGHTPQRLGSPQQFD